MQLSTQAQSDMAYLRQGQETPEQTLARLAALKKERGENRYRAALSFSFYRILGVLILLTYTLVTFCLVIPLPINPTEMLFWGISLAKLIMGGLLLIMFYIMMYMSHLLMRLVEHQLNL
jgi:cellulose synthase/poly-beta-1,6-N-acetylglucosamine synthase-like glycosyltransferase